MQRGWPATCLENMVLGNRMGFDSSALRQICLSNYKASTIPTLNPVGRVMKPRPGTLYKHTASVGQKAGPKSPPGHDEFRNLSVLASKGKRQYAYIWQKHLALLNPQPLRQPTSCHLANLRIAVYVT